MTDSTEHIKTRVEGSVLEIIITRTERKNALSLAMYAAMAGAIHSAVSSENVNVVLLTGSEGVFSSGNDLEDFAVNSQPFDKNHPLVKFMGALAECPLPVVAAVDGIAVGIGTTLLLHCDLVYASPQASFSLPFVNLGLCPEYAASYLLPRLAGYVKAAEFLLLGEKFDAQCALNVGLVNDIAEDPYVLAKEKCLLLSKKAPQAVRTTKALMKSALKPNVDTVFEAEAKAFIHALKGSEFKEAVSAFFEKRDPDFKNISG